MVASGAAARRPPGVSRWANAHGKVSLAGFSYAVGASYAGEPVEVVVAGGLVDIVHAGVVIATLTPAPIRPTGRRGLRWPGGLLHAHRRADGDPAGQRRRDGQLRRHRLPGGPRLGLASRSTSRIVAGSVQRSKDGKVIRVHPIRHDRARELGVFANPKGLPRRKNSAAGTVA